MNWKQKQYVRKKVRIPCPVCEYWLDVSITLKKGVKGEFKEDDKR